MSRRLFAVLLLAAAAAATASAFQAKPANLTGSWTGTLTPDGGGTPGSGYLVLKHTGKELTGTAGPSAENQAPITKGVVTPTKEGTTATFERPTGSGVMLFELKLVKDRLMGTLTMVSGDQKRTATADFQRAK